LEYLIWVQRGYKARCNQETRFLTIPTIPTIRPTTPTGRILRAAIIPTNPTFPRSQKIPMIVKRRQRVLRAVPTTPIPQADRTTPILRAVPTIRIPQADRTTPIPRAAQHPQRHQGRAERAEWAAEFDKIWVWRTAPDCNGKTAKCECVAGPETRRTARNVDSEAACEGLAEVQDR
jgi:hypothetical protein